MNKQDFIRLIKDPSLASSKDTDNLEDLIANFPYCQAAHILIAKISHHNSSMLAKQKLSKAAAYVLERKKLKRTVFCDEVKSKKNAQEQVIYPSGTIVDEPIEASPPEMEIQLKLPPIQLSNFESSKVFLPALSDNNKEHPENSEPIQSNKESLDNLKKDPEVRSAFFRELEENLEKLRHLKEKNELKKFVEDAPPHIPVIKVVEPPSEPVPPLLEEKKEIEILPDNSPVENSPIENFQEENSSKGNFLEQDVPEQNSSNENHIEALMPDQPTEPASNILSQINRGETSEYIIYTSRLQDVLLHSSNENTGVLMESQLLTDYLQFLSSRKKILFRSREKMNDIITKFINEEPTIPHFKNNELFDIVEDLSEESSKVSNHIASENFAKLLIKQGKYKKAVAIYHELILKNPEKKAYFAGQIEALNNKS